MYLNTPLAQSLRNNLTYRVEKVGTLSTEQLFSLSEDQLKACWLTYRKKMGSTSDDLLNELDPEAAGQTTADKALTIRVDVLKLIYQDKKARSEAASKAVVTRAKTNRRQDLIAMKSLSNEQAFIEAMTTSETAVFAELTTEEQDAAIKMGIVEWRKTLK